RVETWGEHRTGAQRDADAGGRVEERKPRAALAQSTASSGLDVSAARRRDGDGETGGADAAGRGRVRPADRMRERREFAAGAGRSAPSRIRGAVGSRGGAEAYAQAIPYPRVGPYPPPPRISRLPPPPRTQT